MTYKVVITDDSGKEVFVGKVVMNNAIDAGVAAENILDEFHLEHPCHKCIHHLKVLFASMKGGQENGQKN